ncbi:MAG: nitroreductase family protein [Promethearchaeota archaeon]
MRQFYELITSRRSIRELKEKPVALAQLNRVLEATLWAPSAHNAQPWRFFVLQSMKEKARLANAMGNVLRQDLTADGEEPMKIDELVATSITRFTSAPVLILACLTMEPMDVYPDDKRQRAEYTMAVQSVAAAIQTLLLTAHAEGLAGCWFCAPLFCPDTVQQILRLPETVIPQALVTLGYADDMPDPPPRQPLEKLVRFIKGEGC